MSNEIDSIIDKITPKKPDYWNGLFSCPTCKITLGPVYDKNLPKVFSVCKVCNQKLKWKGCFK